MPDTCLFVAFLGTWRRFKKISRNSIYLRHSRGLIVTAHYGVFGKSSWSKVLRDVIRILYEQSFRSETRFERYFDALCVTYTLMNGNVDGSDMEL